MCTRGTLKEYQTETKSCLSIFVKLEFDGTVILCQNNGRLADQGIRKILF